MPHMRPTEQSIEQQILALERIGRFIAPFTRWDRRDIEPEVAEMLHSADHWLRGAIVLLRKRQHENNNVE